MRLVRQLAEYTISLKQLEDNLLARLAASQVCWQADGQNMQASTANIRFH